MTNKAPREITDSDIVHYGSCNNFGELKYKKTDILMTDVFREKIDPSPKPAYGWPDDHRMFMILGNIYGPTTRNRSDIIELKSNINDERVRYREVLYRPTNVFVQAHHLGAGTEVNRGWLKKDFGAPRKMEFYCLADRLEFPYHAQYQQLDNIFDTIQNKKYRIITKYGVEFISNYHIYHKNIHLMVVAENLIGPENVNFGAIIPHGGKYAPSVMAESSAAKKLFSKMAIDYFAVRAVASQHHYDMGLKVRDLPKTITSPQMWKEVIKFHDISLGWPDIPEVQKEVKRIVDWKKDVPIGYKLGYK